MNRWITSDTHFGHQNIFRYCPWRTTLGATIEQHDQALIAAWNETVQPGDVVYHLGDFAMGQRSRVASLRAQLTGDVVVVLGNHDWGALQMAAAGFRPIKQMELELFGQKIVMRHDPHSFVPEEREEAALLLHGHWHGVRSPWDSALFSEACRRKLVDVGMDARCDPRPAPLDAFVEAALKRLAVV